MNEEKAKLRLLDELQSFENTARKRKILTRTS